MVRLMPYAVLVVMLVGCGGSDEAGPSVDADSGTAELAAGDGWVPDLGIDADSDAPEVRTQPGQLSAYKVEDEGQLIGGDNAYGMPGKSFVLENDRIRALIQGGGTSVHLCLYGGNIIDGDVNRTGEAGNDQFREMFPVIGFRAAGVDSVEVVKDGSDGEEAIVRVVGEDQPSGLIGVLDALAMPLNAIITTDYVLKPGENRLLIRTTVANPNDAPLGPLMVGDFLAFGGGHRLFTAGAGFTGAATSTAALVSVAPGVSYGYAVQKNAFDVPLVDANGTMSFLSTDFVVPPGGQKAFARYFVIGSGDLASVLDSVLDLREQAFHTASGAVIDADGPVAKAMVTAFSSGEGTPQAGGHAVSQALTDHEGRFHLRLVPGQYDFVFSAPGRTRVYLAQQDLAAGDLELEAEMGGVGKVALSVVEGGAGGPETPIPAKASLYCLDDGEPPWKELGESERHGLCDTLFTVDGGGQLLVAPGSYRAIVSRGIEYEIAEVDPLVVTEGATTPLEASLLRSVDTPGYLSGDFHQHTVGSIDAGPTHVDKIIENLAEGVEIAAATDHDNMTSYGPAIAQLGVEHLVASIDGDEVSVNGVGHFNIFDIEHDGPDLYPFLGVKFFSGKSIADLFADIHSVPGVEVLQVNHPRSEGSGYFRYLKFDPVSGQALGEEEMALDFQSVEVKADLGYPKQYLEEFDDEMHQLALKKPGDVPVMRDWFSLLNLGEHICGMGNSDAHNWNDGVGYSRNFLRVDTDAPGEVTEQQVMEAIKAQRNVVSNGPLIRVFFDGEEAMGWQEPVAAPGGEVSVVVEIQAATWIPVNVLEIYRNGRPLYLQLEGDQLMAAADGVSGGALQLPIAPELAEGVVRLSVPLTLSCEENCWFVFLTRGNADLGPVGDGHPFAYTNPIYLQVL